MQRCETAVKTKHQDLLKDDPVEVDLRNFRMIFPNNTIEKKWKNILSTRPRPKHIRIK